MLKKILKGIGFLFLIAIIIASYLIYNIINQHNKLLSGELINETVLEEIPFTYSSTGHMLIQVKIEGSNQSYPFILDSGASNFIFSNHLNEFDLNSNGYGIGLGANGNFFLTKIRKIDSLQIGKIKFKNLNANQKDFNFSCSENVYGLIGIGVMHHLVWQIDFKNKTILISKKLENLSFGENKIEIPLLKNERSNHLNAVIQFKKNGKTKSALVDLGSNTNLTIQEKTILRDSLPLNSKNIKGTSSQGLGGESSSDSNEKIYLLDSLFFNKTNYSVIKFPINSTPAGLSLLGLGFFENYKTTISWEDKKLILEPYDSVQNFIWNTAGFSTKYDKDLQKVIIKSITENTAASDSKIPLNAEIISINEYLFTDEASYCNYREAKIKPDTLNLKVKDSTGIIKEFQIIKQPVF